MASDPPPSHPTATATATAGGQAPRAELLATDFLANLAHELRNPLAPIASAVQVLGIPGIEPALAERSRQVIARQVAQLARLVDDLLDLSRLSSGQLELHRRRLDMGEVIRAAVEASRPHIEAGEHQLRIELGGEAVRLDADRERLSQVLAHLLHNAAKYSPDGSCITLRVRAMDGHAEVTVADEGIGIPAEMLARVFDLFTQVDAGQDRARSGLGIGLTLVQRLVALHGGTVRAESDGPGRGSRFTLTLPLPPRAARAAGTAESEAMAAPPLRVLVVDDNHDSAAMLRELLALLGHDVEVAFDGESALAAAARFAPRLVLLDLGMPGMSGYEVARRLRATPAGAAMTLVALTGWGQEEDRRRSQEAGFDHHLVKPAELADLRRVLAAARD